MLLMMMMLKLLLGLNLAVGVNILSVSVVLALPSLGQRTQTNPVDHLLERRQLDAQQGIRTTTSNPPPLRLMSATVQSGSKLYIIGGYFPSQPFPNNSTYESDNTPSNSEEGVADSSLIVCDKAVIVYDMITGIWDMEAGIDLEIGLCGHSATLVWNTEENNVYSNISQEDNIQTGNLGATFLSKAVRKATLRF